MIGGLRVFESCPPREALTLNILIDYDNLRPLQKSRGLLYVVELILASVGGIFLEETRRVRVRVYGGWDEAGRPTTRAQTVSAEIQRDFPICRGLEWSGKRILTTIAAEMAQSLECDPKLALLDTYRPFYRAREVNCKDPVGVGGCAEEPCLMMPVFSYFQTLRCPNSACIIAFDDLFTQPTQKMIDTMILSDLVHLTLKKESKIVIVGSDDDLWPGIRLGLHLGATIAHVHTRAGRTTPKVYVPFQLERYSQFSI